MALKKDSNYTRLDLNVPISLKNRLLDYSNNMGLNLTSGIILLLNKALNEKNN